MAGRAHGAPRDRPRRSISMNETTPDQNPGNSGVPPVIPAQPATPPPLPPGNPSASLFLPRSPEIALTGILSRIETRQRRLRLWLKLPGCWAAAALLGICLLLIQRE